MKLLNFIMKEMIQAAKAMRSSFLSFFFRMKAYGYWLGTGGYVASVLASPSGAMEDSVE